MVDIVDLSNVVRVMFHLSETTALRSGSGQQFHLMPNGKTLLVHFAGTASDQILLCLLAKFTQDKEVRIDAYKPDMNPDGTTNLVLLQESLKKYGIVVESTHD